MGWKFRFITYWAGEAHHSCTSAFIYSLVHLHVDSFLAALSLSQAKGMACFHSSLQIPEGRFFGSSGPFLCPCMLRLFQGQGERAATRSRCDSWLRVVALHDLDSVPSITRHRHWVFLDLLLSLYGGQMLDRSQGQRRRPNLAGCGISPYREGGGQEDQGSNGCLVGSSAHFWGVLVGQKRLGGV